MPDMPLFGLFQMRGMATVRESGCAHEDFVCKEAFSACQVSPWLWRGVQWRPSSDAAGKGICHENIKEVTTKCNHQSQRKQVQHHATVGYDGVFFGGA